MWSPMRPRRFCRLPPPTRCGRKKRQDAAILTVRRGWDVGLRGMSGGRRAGGKLVSFSLAFPLPLILLLFLLPPAPYRRLCAPFLFENCILSVSHGSSEHLRRFTASRICRCGAGTRADFDPPLPFPGQGGAAISARSCVTELQKVRSQLSRTVLI